MIAAPLIRLAAASVVLAAATPAIGADEDFPPAALEFFEKKVRPLLANRCYECHSSRSDEPEGELLLDSRTAMVEGGASGPAIVPGKPEESLLLAAVRYESLEMPPREKLPAREVEVLRKWIEIGAPWPAGEVTHGPARRTEFRITQEDRDHWAWQPLVRPSLPSDQSPVHPIDAFLDAQLQDAGITPNPTASPRELQRRIYFDLIGLPPPVEEVGQFDGSAQACAELVDRLLASQAYGERWGRHWLDLVRFAQTNGYERDAEKPFAWRYRDYVIAAFNADKPFDRFVLEQLAGDQLEDRDSESIIATGFYRLGVWDDEPDDSRQAEFDALDDVLSTVGTVFLGQTIGCARCHDHMFEPISQRDYYEMLAFVRDIRPYEKPVYTLESPIFRPLADDRAVATWQEQQRVRLADVEARLQQTELTADQKKELNNQLKDVRAERPPFELALAVRDGESRPTHVLIRGNPGTPGDQVQPAIPDVLGDRPRDFTTADRRLALAEWIVSSESPVTARVIANRLWQHHFGQGLVTSPNDFGRAAEPPLSPQLLDWLAAELVASDWSLKSLHRTIMRSRAYRRSSRVGNDRASERDPANRLLWRGNLRRLDAEAVRDAVVAVSGELNAASGGRGFFPRLSGEVVSGQSRPGLGWESSSDDERRRRSVYAFVKRGLRDPLAEAFDYVNTTSSLDVRPTTTVAPQALILLNSRFMDEAAARLADRVVKDAGESVAARIRHLYRITLARDPVPQEVQAATEFLRAQSTGFRTRSRVLVFRENAPESLAQQYRDQLRPEDYLLGPGSGWDYYVGQWGGQYEGIAVVDPQRRPFGLWQGPAFSDSEITGRLLLPRSADSASLVRGTVPTLAGAASPQINHRLSGWEIRLDTVQQRVSLHQHTRQVVELAGVSVSVPADQWVTFRLMTRGRRVRFWIGDGDAPVIDVTDDRLSSTGRFGVSGSIQLDGVDVQLANQTWDLAGALAIEPSANPRGWTVFGGDWTFTPEGTACVESNYGAKLVHETSFVDGVLTAEVKLSGPEPRIGGLLLSVSEPRVGADNWYGYEISLDAAEQRVLLGDHRQNWSPRQSRPVKVETDRWYRLRVERRGGRLRVWLDDGSEPVIDYTDAEPLPAGSVGLRTWGTSMSWRNVRIDGGERAEPLSLAGRPAGPRRGPSPDPDEFARRKAFQALCLVMLNLNEFLYID